jgi:hypothetical protein
MSSILEIQKRVFVNEIRPSTPFREERKSLKVVNPSKCPVFNLRKPRTRFEESTEILFAKLFDRRGQDLQWTKAQTQIRR